MSPFIKEEAVAATPTALENRQSQFSQTPPKPQSKSTRSIITFNAYFNGDSKTYEVKGRGAETLLCLVQAGGAGITALEVNSSAYRLASYIHDLRHTYNLDIQTVMERHAGGEHARYVLITAVVIIRIEQR